MKEWATPRLIYISSHQLNDIIATHAYTCVLLHARS